MAARKKLSRSIAGDIALLLLLLLVAAFMMLPLVYSVSAALKPMSEFWIFPPAFLPTNPTLQNFRDLFTVMSGSWVPFSRYLFNTVFITFAGTAGHVILSSMCAYSLCKLQFPGHQFVFKIIVYSLMFNGAVTAIPNFLVLHFFGLIDHYASIILVAFASSLGLYLMKQFMEEMVPDTLLEAARIDGAGNTRLFFRIVMPVVRPAWLTLILFSFQGLWSTGESAAIQSEEMKTLNYAVSQIAASGIARAGAGAAATVFMMIAPILVFLITQSNVVETMATSGMKD